MGVRYWPELELAIKARRIPPSAFVLVGTPPRYRAVTSWDQSFDDADYTVAISGDDARSWSWGLKTKTTIGIESNSSTALAGDVLVLAVSRGEHRVRAST